MLVGAWAGWTLRAGLPVDGAIFGVGNCTVSGSVCGIPVRTGDGTLVDGNGPVLAGGSDGDGGAPRLGLVTSTLL